nr:hypothetical protein [Tanacetum cinerariifolium]
MKKRCSTVLLNKLPSKEKDLGSSTIPCDIGNLHIDNALADLGASIRLIPYTMYEKLENVLIKVDKFILSINFVILDMQEDSRIPIILGRLLFATTKAMIDVFNKKITLRVGDNEELLEDDQMVSFLVSNLEKRIVQSNPKSGDSEEPIRRITREDTSYLKTQGSKRAQNEHLYFASANELNKKKPQLKELPPHLEYAYLKGDESCLVIISSKLTKNEKNFTFADKMLSRCEETNLVPNWEKYHFMVKEGIVLGHKISGKGIKVDKAKIDVISKLPYPTNVKGVRSF